MVAGTKLKCPKCGHVWEYKDKGTYYASCVRCLRKVNVVKNMVE